MNNEITNPFPSVSALCEMLGLPESKFGLGWRLTDAVLGEINAIKKARGRVVATDGMMCVIVTEDNKFCFGHYSWFVPDEEENEEDETTSAKAKRKARKPKILVEFKA